MTFALQLGAIDEACIHHFLGFPSMQFFGLHKHSAKNTNATFNLLIACAEIGKNIREMRLKIKRTLNSHIL